MPLVNVELAVLSDKDGLKTWDSFIVPVEVDADDIPTDHMLDEEFAVAEMHLESAAYQKCVFSEDVVGTMMLSFSTDYVPEEEDDDDGV